MVEIKKKNLSFNEFVALALYVRANKTNHPLNQKIRKKAQKLIEEYDIGEEDLERIYNSLTEVKE